MKFIAEFFKTSSELTEYGPMAIRVRIALMRTRENDFAPDVFFQGEYTGREHLGHFSGASSQIEKVFPSGEEALKWANELRDRIKKDLDAYRRMMIPAKIEREL